MKKPLSKRREFEIESLTAFDFSFSGDGITGYIGFPGKWKVRSVFPSRGFHTWRAIAERVKS